MDFIDIIRRIQNMKFYGLSLEEIHNKLTGEGVSEDTIFFAYKGAEMLEE